MEGLTGAVVIAAYDPENPSSAQRAQMAQVVGQLVTMKYGRDDELESDRLGARFSEAEMTMVPTVMEIFTPYPEGVANQNFLVPTPIQKIGLRDRGRHCGGIPQWGAGRFD